MTLGFDFSFAFQPIVDVTKRSIFAYEALVRGVDGSPSAGVFAHVNESNRYTFDMVARAQAIELASTLYSDDATLLALNFMPNAVFESARCIRSTLAAAHLVGFPTNRIMFELTEHEQVFDIKQVRQTFDQYRSYGFVTAIDDFGAGFAGLTLLAEFRPHMVKIDKTIIRGIDSDVRRQARLRRILSTARAMNITPIAEGVETCAELAHLRTAGIDLFQGYYLARPALEALPQVDFGQLLLDGDDVNSRRAFA